MRKNTNKKKVTVRVTERSARTDRAKKDPNLKLYPAYPGQLVKSMRVEGAPLLVSTVTGLTALAVVASNANVTNFSTRFASLFEEYRIVGVQYRVKFFSSGATGIIVTWYDEKNISTPTLAESMTKSEPSLAVNLSRVERDLVLKWTPHDTVDLQYQPTTGAAFPVGAFKLYTDSANYGTAAATVPICQVYQTFWLQFRGLK